MENTKPHFHIVLVAPEIPGNTGSIGRTCLSLNLQLHLIRPLGFDLSEKAVRRAGLDYWKYVKVSEYDSFEEFLSQNAVESQQLFFFDNNLDQLKTKNIYQAKFQADCYLVFGQETKGIPKKILEHYSEQIFELPNYSDRIRSLNLSNAATAVAFEALRQILFRNF
jgi:tRNA (cytidine/uridine-2'-O-)-methyltransferase